MKNNDVSTNQKNNLPVPFENFISLGYSCPVASSMSKYGLRSFSGPFDWLTTTDLSFVLKYIENDFTDFLLKENLAQYDKHPKSFIETTSGFTFIHESVSFLDDYDSLYNKYSRRIARFLSETSKPTCFFRAISNENEIKYIIENATYIANVIKKNNQFSEIVFLGNENINVDKENFPFRFFKLNGMYSGISRYILRSWFDNENELLDFCSKNYNSYSLMKNIIFDQNNELKYQKKLSVIQINSGRYNLLIKLLNADLSKVSLPDEVIIYGAGNIGKQFYTLIKDKCKVLCFVDKYKSGSNIDGIPVVTMDMIDRRDVPFIVTATYDFARISKKIHTHINDATIISLDKLIS